MDAWSDIARRVRSNGAAPLVTFYDDARGERVELSATSFANGVAKVANLLVDRDAESLTIALPLHWQGVIWATAGLVAGVDVDLLHGGQVGDIEAALEAGADSDMWLIGPDALEGIEASGLGTRSEVVALSLHPFGLGFPPARAAFVEALGLEDGSPLVRNQPDALMGAPGSGMVRLVGVGERVEWGELAAAARAGLEARGAGATPRVLVTRFPDSVEDLAVLLAGSLASGGSLVLVRDPDPAADHGSIEGVTLVW